MIPTVDRIYAQYRNKPKATAWYNITRKLATEIDSAANAVRVMYNIDLATEDRLDILGRIVGIGRNFVAPVTLHPPQCAAADMNPAEFGDSSAMMSALSTDADAALNDDMFRLVIKAKILKNNSQSTIEDILFGANFLLPNANVTRLIDGEDMSFSIEFYGTITEIERYALLNVNLIPKPQGVRFSGYLEGLGYVQAGDTSFEFGDTMAQATGFTGI